MKKYVSRCQVLDSGKKISDLKNFKWNERKYAELIKTMDGVGLVDTIPDQTFSFDYVIPTSSPRLDWSDFQDKTVTVLLKSGKRITFSGVCATGEGEVSFDGEKESTMPVTFAYESFIIE